MATNLWRVVVAVVVALFLVSVTPWVLNWLHDYSDYVYCQMHPQRQHQSWSMCYQESLP